jgi:2-dehydropantoate 2-reductase
MRIAIYGTGGVGGVFGGQLAAAGEDVWFIARGAHLDAIRSTGLRVTMDDREIVVQPAQATDDPAEIGEVDAVLLCVKTWQVAEAGRAMAPMMGPDTVVVTLQNGVEAAAQLAEVIGEKHVLAGLCGTISWVDGPGRIRNIGAVNFIRFGEMDNTRTERAERLAAVMTNAGITSEVPDDIEAALWQKFLFNAPAGAVAAAARAPIGVTRSLPETRALHEAAIAEVVAVARARKVALPPDADVTMMTVIDSLPAETTVSMQRDIMEGKPSELDAWVGAVVRLGHEAGVPTHDLLYGVLLPHERRARGELTFD